MNISVQLDIVNCLQAVSILEPNMHYVWLKTDTPDRVLPNTHKRKLAP